MPRNEGEGRGRGAGRGTNGQEIVEGGLTIVADTVS